MTRLLKKTISIFLIITLLFLSVIWVNAEAEYQSGDWTYTLNRNIATITRYNGTQTDITFPTSLDGCSVKHIGYSCFKENGSIISITIPEGFISVGDYAFLNCGNLKTVKIPKSIQDIGVGSYTGSCFENCTSLESVTLAEGGTEEARIHTAAFTGCTALKSITIPSNYKNTGNSAFAGCTNLSTVIIKGNLDPNFERTVDYRSFADCIALTIVHIPENVKTIDETSFANCSDSLTICSTSSAGAVKDYAQNNSLKFKLCDGNHTATPNSPSSGYDIGIFSTEKSFTVETDKSMWLAFGLMEGDILLGEWMPMAITVSDPTVISLSAYEKTDYGYTLEVTGKKEGSSNLTITDTDTGLTTDIVVTVQDLYSRTFSYPIEEMKTFYPENKWENHIETNLYNINGLYVNNYSCSKSGNKYNVSFDVYNEKYHIGAVDVYDADGNWTGSKKIDKNKEMTSLYEWGEQVYYLFAKGDWVAYTHPMHTKHTPIEIEVPDGGYFVISNNFAESPGCFYHNSIDFFIQGSVAFFELAAGNVDNTVKEFIDVLNEEIKNNKVLREMLYEAFANIGSDTLKAISQNILDGNVEDSCSDIVDLLENILNSTLSVFNWKNCLESVTGIGESLFEEFAGPAGKALKVCFSISKSLNILGQARNIAYSMDTPFVNMYSKIPEGFVAPNGTIVNTNGNMDTEAVLQVFKIYNNNSADSLIENNTTKDYDLYNICFVKNDALVQPNGKVKVYMPIPDNLKSDTCKIYRQESNGSWTDIYAWVENNYLVFETDHFSLYAIVGEKADIEIQSLPQKLTYTIGDTLDIDGLSFRINGESITSGFYCEPSVLYSVGKQKITVNYNGLSEDFEITVNAESPEIIPPSVTTVNYGDTLVLSIKDIKLPAGCSIDWSISGEGFSKSVSEDGTQCRLTSTSNGITTINVKIVDKNGVPLHNADGSELCSEITLKSKAGFFQKLISFFKNLFRISRIILQSI